MLRYARAVVDLCERERVRHRKFAPPARGDGRGEGDAQHVLVRAAHLPARTGRDGADLHAAAACARIVGGRGETCRNGRMRRSLAVGVAVEVEPKLIAAAARIVIIRDGHLRREHALLIRRIDRVERAFPLPRAAREEDEHERADERRRSK